MALRLFIWEGDGISDAYHDDGTLVVLAESPEQARELVRKGRADIAATDDAWRAERVVLLAEFDKTGGERRDFQKWAESRSTVPYPMFDSAFFDGSDHALDREPDRVLEVDKPAWVAFNGGGYD